MAKYSNMLETTLLFLHNLLRWVILVTLLYAITRSWSAMRAKRAFTAGERKGALIMLISAHLTLVIGLYQWLFGRYGIISTSLPPGNRPDEGQVLSLLLGRASLRHGRGDHPDHDRV